MAQAVARLLVHELPRKEKLAALGVCVRVRACARVCVVHARTLHNNNTTDN